MLQYPVHPAKLMASKLEPGNELSDNSTRLALIQS